MEDAYGPNYITLQDDDGVEFELEHLETFLFEGQEYMVFLPADLDEEDPDYGLIILQLQEENNEEILATVDDEDLLQRVYEYYMQTVFEEEDSEEEGEETL